MGENFWSWKKTEKNSNYDWTLENRRERRENRYLRVEIRVGKKKNIWLCKKGKFILGWFLFFSIILFFQKQKLKLHSVYIFPLLYKM